MIDKEKLKKAQEWADQASEMAEYSPTMPERAKAAAEVIKSLPSTVVDGEKLREVVADHHIDMSEELMEALGALLPTPPAPRTMSKIEWDDAEHHLAEAEHSVYGKVAMMGIDGRGNIVVLMGKRLHSVTPSALTPTGRKLRLEPDEGALKGEPVQTGFDPAYTYRDRDGDMWTHNGKGWVCNDGDHQEFDSPLAGFGPYTQIYPAYLYRDKDGDVWEHIEGRWVTGDTHAKRVTTREDSLGRASLPAEYGPYTRIEKESKHDH